MILASSAHLHIPDGFVSLPVALVTWLLAALILRQSARRAEARFDERLVPLAGILAAFIFAAQMINFPVAGGTSGHLVGATLAAIVLGPWLGILVMTAVIALQALLFQDGGLLVMGANILVMGVAPTLIGYGLYRGAVTRRATTRRALAGAAAWFSIMAAAFLTALLLGFSGTSSFRVVVPAMLGIHALIGAGEALITVAALAFLERARPQLLAESVAGSGRAWTAAGLILTLVVVLLAPFASGLPDGLEWVAGEQGFLQQGRSAPYEILPDYTVPFLGETALSTIAAGLAGTLLVLALTLWGLRLLRPRGLARSRGE